MGWMQTFLHVDKGKSLGESTDRNMTVILWSLNLQRLNYFILLILFLIIEINGKWQDKIRALQGLWWKCLAIWFKPWFPLENYINLTWQNFQVTFALHYMSLRRRWKRKGLDMRNHKIIRKNPLNELTVLGTWFSKNSTTVTVHVVEKCNQN